MAKKKNYLLYAGIVVVIGLGVAYYKKWPPLMKFIHGPKVPPQAPPHPAAVAQPQMLPQRQQGVHPMGVMPGAVATQPGYGFGGGMPMMQMQYPQMMPQMPTMMPQTMPMMQPTMGMMPPTLMPGMSYGQVV